MIQDNSVMSKNELSTIEPKKLGKNPVKVSREDIDGKIDIERPDTCLAGGPPRL